MTHYQDEKDDLLDYFACMLQSPEEEGDDPAAQEKATVLKTSLEADEHSSVQADTLAQTDHRKEVDAASTESSERKISLSAKTDAGEMSADVCKSRPLVAEISEDDLGNESTEVPEEIIKAAPEAVVSAETEDKDTCVLDETDEFVAEDQGAEPLVAEVSEDDLGNESADVPEEIIESDPKSTDSEGFADGAAAQLSESSPDPESIVSLEDPAVESIKSLESEPEAYDLKAAEAADIVDENNAEAKVVIAQNGNEELPFAQSVAFDSSAESLEPLTAGSDEELGSEAEVASVIPVIAPILEAHDDENVLNNASESKAYDLKADATIQSVSVEKNDGTQALDATTQSISEEAPEIKTEEKPQDPHGHDTDSDQEPEPAVKLQEESISEQKSTFVRTAPSLEALLEQVECHVEQGEVQKLDQRAEEEVSLKVEEKLEQKTEEEVAQKVEEKLEQKTEEEVAQKVEEKLEQKTEEEVAQKVEEKLEQKTEEEVAQKVEEKLEQKTEEEVAQKVEEKLEQKTEEEVAQKVEEKLEQKTEEEVAQKVEEKLEQKTEEEVAQKVEAPVAQKELQQEAQSTVNEVKNAEEVVETSVANASENKSEPTELTWTKLELPDEFQVLFFLVKGVRFAVPLIYLGGIFECTRLTQIAGRPSWYKGMSDIRGTKLSVVDTMAWVKPEDKKVHDYKYLIVLDRSNWALGCDELEGNRVLQSSQIKLRQKAGGRPWLAGIVKKEMCALLHVKAMTAMFDCGMDLNKKL